MDWGDPAHVVLHAPPGGKSSINIFGSDSNYGQDSKPSRQPPPQTYGGFQNENQRPMHQEPPRYAPPPSQAPVFGEATTFGARKAMRSENNIGGDGGERPSVKLHAAPGGQQHFNIFGGYEPSAAAHVSKPAPPSYSAPPPSYSAPAPAPSY